MYSVVLSAGSLFFCSTGSYQWLCYSIPWVGWTYLLIKWAYICSGYYLKDLGYSLNSKWAVLVIVNNNKWGGGHRGQKIKLKQKTQTNDKQRSTWTPDLEIREWGLKIFDGTNSLRSFNASTVLSIDTCTQLIITHWVCLHSYSMVWGYILFMYPQS